MIVIGANFSQNLDAQNSNRIAVLAMRIDVYDHKTKRQSICVPVPGQEKTWIFYFNIKPTTTTNKLVSNKSNSPDNYKTIL